MTEQRTHKNLHTHMYIKILEDMMCQVSHVHEVMDAQVCDSRAYLA